MSLHSLQSIAAGCGVTVAARARESLRSPIPGVVLCGLLLSLAGACGGPSAEAPDPRTARDTAEEAEEALFREVSFPEEWRYPADADPVAAERAMVVTTDSLASAAGLEVLREGGNAVDAAVAVHFVLAVVHPQAGNIGGGGFLVTRQADGDSAALDFREEAPGDATADMFVGEDGEVTEASWTGHRASGVPGSVAGMADAHRRFGSLPWERLLRPAVRLASEGFEVGSDLHGALASRSERLRQFESTEAHFFPDGEPPAAGTAFAQPDLARALTSIAERGPRAFYEGWIADSLVAEMERGGGILTREDLAAYEPEWREPVHSEYRDRRILSMPPASSGGITVALMLNILERFQLRRMGWGSTDAVHVMVEAMRRGYGDRNFYLGDPEFVEIPRERLLSQSHADSLGASIRLGQASSSEEFNMVPTAMTGEGQETTHYSIVDPAGNAVSVTTTLNGSFGSGVVVPGAGFFLNNEMDDFTAKPGEPNQYGLIQGEANAIRPGKRMLSAMTPTILIGPDDRTELITGTPGGATIITTVLQIVTGMVDFRMPPQTAVNAPRFHHQNLPDRVQYEDDGLRPVVVDSLRQRGHDIAERSGISGDVQSIWIDPDGLRHGASDPRRGGEALGF